MSPSQLKSCDTVASWPPGKGEGGYTHCISPLRFLEEMVMKQVDLNNINMPLTPPESKITIRRKERLLGRMELISLPSSSGLITFLVTWWNLPWCCNSCILRDWKSSLAAGLIYNLASCHGCSPQWLNIGEHISGWLTLSRDSFQLNPQLIFLFLSLFIYLFF